MRSVKAAKVLLVYYRIFPQMTSLLSWPSASHYNVTNMITVFHYSLASLLSRRVFQLENSKICPQFTLSQTSESHQRSRSHFATHMTVLYTIWAKNFEQNGLIETPNFGGIFAKQLRKRHANPCKPSHPWFSHIHVSVAAESHSQLCEMSLAWVCFSGQLAANTWGYPGA